MAFHSVYCQVCASQHEYLETFHEIYSDRGVHVLVILGDEGAPGPESLTSSGCAEFASDAGLTLPVLRDPGFAAAGDFTRRGVPAQVLIDSDFLLRTVEQGWDASFQEARFEQLVGEILSDTPESP